MLGIHRHVERVRCFATDMAECGPLSQHYAGVHPIPVREIVGSVGRSHELRSNFMPIQAHWGSCPTDHRYSQVLAAMQHDVPLPAIEVYRLGNRYYVLDGNHRVAAALATGHISIDAVVTDFQPVSTTLEHLAA